MLLKYWNVVDKSDGEVLRTLFDRERAETWLASERKDSDVDMSIEAHTGVVEEAAAALALHFEVDPETVDQRHGVWTVESEPGEYRVLTDDEADAAQREYWDSYPEDTDMMRDWPDVARDYFDHDSWVRDQITAQDSGGGRGECLASYDGQEREVCIDSDVGEYLYIYRVG